MESKNKFFLCTQKNPKQPNRRKKIVLGKTTSDSSELLRPGAQAWRREPKSFLFPSFQNRRVRCRWTIGWRLVPWPLIGVCSGRLTQIAKCCHSQEEGGEQGIMTQVFLGWYSLQGCFLSRGALRLLWISTEHLIPTEAVSAAPCLVLLPSYTFPVTSGHAGVTQRLRVTHSCPRRAAALAGIPRAARRAQPGSAGAVLWGLFLSCTSEK